MSNQKQLSPAEKNMLFAQLTRQNWQKLPAVGLPENSTIQFSIPKTRLTSRIALLVQGTFKATHASNTPFTPARFAPYAYLRNVRVEINNGFNPFNTSGIGAYEYNMTRYANNQILAPATTSKRGLAMCTGVASSSGADNSFRFTVDLPFTLNDRDTAGIILTQNEEVVVNVTIDSASVLSAILNSAAGYSVSNVSVSVTPMVETFTIPVIPEAMPDLSVIKLVHEQTYTISQTGDFTIKLPVGTTYRKILLDFSDSSGNAFADGDVQSFQMILNQADQPYNIESQQLIAENHKIYGQPLPNGLWAFDFTYAGLVNYSGSRDYVDTERLTEFWIRANVSKTGSVRVVYETLAKLKGM